MTNPYNNNLLSQINSLVLKFKEYNIQSYDPNTIKNDILQIQEYKLPGELIKKYEIILTIDTTSDIAIYDPHVYLHDLIIKLQNIISQRLNDGNNLKFQLKIIFVTNTSTVIPINISFFRLVLDNIFSIVPYHNVLVLLHNIHSETQDLVLFAFDKISKIDYKIFGLKVILNEYQIHDSNFIQIVNNISIERLVIIGSVSNILADVLIFIKRFLDVYKFDYLYISVFENVGKGIFTIRARYEHYNDLYIIDSLSGVGIITKQQYDMLSYIINKCHKHIHLYLAYTEFGRLTMLLFTNMLRKNHNIIHITILHLNNNMGSDVLKNISSALKTNNTLRRLDLLDMNISDYSIKKLCNALVLNKSIRDIILSNCNISTYSIILLSDLISENNIIETIDISYNNIGDDGIIPFFNALKKNRGIKKLNIGNINITERSMILFSQVLVVNNTLEQIDLSGNNINIDGLKLITNTIKHNTTIKILYIHDIRIENEGAKLLIDMLKENIVIENIKWDTDNIDEKLNKQIKTLLEPINRKQRLEWHPRTHQLTMSLNPEFDNTLVDMLSIFEQLKQKRDEEKRKKRLLLLESENKKF